LAYYLLAKFFTIPILLTSYRKPLRRTPIKNVPRLFGFPTVAFHGILSSACLVDLKIHKAVIMYRAVIRESGNLFEIFPSERSVPSRYDIKGKVNVGLDLDYNLSRHRSPALDHVLDERSRSSPSLARTDKPDVCRRAPSL